MNDRIVRFRWAPSATWREIDGEVVVISIDVNRVRLLNRVGSFIWSQCEGRTVDELAAAVCERFDVEEEVARRDIDVFVQDLIARGMLVAEAS